MRNNKAFRGWQLISCILSAVMICTLAFAVAPNEVRADIVYGDFTYYINEDNTAVISKYTGTAANVIVPGNIKGRTVVTLGENAFSNNDHIVSVSFEPGIRVIGKDAFTNCNSLSSVVLSNTVTEISGFAFSSCDNLENVLIPNGLTSIGRYAFSNCSQLTEINLPNSVTSLGDHVFYYCTGIESITLPDSISTIGDGAFQYCANLSEVNLPANLQSVPYHMFAFCDSLEKITIPSSVTVIERTAFWEAMGLTEIVITSSNTVIEDGAFTGCNTSQITIKAPANSPAQDFAQGSGMPSEVITPPTGAPSATPTPMPTSMPTTPPGTTPGAIPPATGNTVNRSAAEAFVTRCYELVLGRSPDPTGLNNWVNSLVNNQNTGAHMAYGFFFSQEYINSNTTNEQYVTTLYNVFLDRQPDAAGLADWVGQLERGATREQIFAGVVNSREFFALCNTYGITAGHYIQGIDNTRQQNVNAFVARLYSMCLGRNGDYDGQASWVRQLINGENSGAGVGYGFFFSPEFINRNLTNEEYTATLYRVFLGREPDQAGFNDWVSQLNGGADRLSIFRGFAHSQEYTNICSSYGIVRGTI